MKVSELVERLLQEDQDAEAHFSYNYGDHWQTQVSQEVKLVEPAYVEPSEYHRMDKIVDDDAVTKEEREAEEEERDPTHRRVVCMFASTLR